MDLFLVDNMAVPEGMMKMLSKQKGVWSGHLENIQSTDHTAKLKEVTQLYTATVLSRRAKFWRGGL